MKIEVEKCLRPDCQYPAGPKGLCLACYSIARVLVLQKEYTWEELAAKGKAIIERKQSSSPQRAWKAYAWFRGD